MGDERHPDRASWPAYWRGIRTATVWSLVIAVIVGGGALLPRPEGLAPGIAIEALIGLVATFLATFLANRVDAWWDARDA